MKHETLKPETSNEVISFNRIHYQFQTSKITHNFNVIHPKAVHSKINTGF
jgi:hypothetical protein